MPRERWADPEVDAYVRRLGYRIQRARERKGWFQRDLAAMVEAEQSLVCRWERADCMPRIDALFRLSRALGVGLNDLLDSRPRPGEP